MDILGIINQYALPFALGFSAVSFYVVYIKNILKEVSELLVVVVNAVEDNKVTAEEISKIIKEAKDIVEVAKKYKRK